MAATQITQTTTQTTVQTTQSGSESTTGHMAGERFTDRYTVEEELGRGTFSVVVRATDKFTGESVAVKILNKTDCYAKLEKELQLLRAMSHPYIIKFICSYESTTKLFVVLELARGGELFNRIVERNCYTERDAAEVIRKVTEAVRFLHLNNVIHRDLKPENLLLRTLESDTDVCIADFGLARIIPESVMVTTACGSPAYVAPEVLEGQGYGPLADMWSIGVISYILLCGYPPFYSDTLPDLLEKIQTCEYGMNEEDWRYISDEAKDFVTGLLVPCESRMTAQQALIHPWLNGSCGSAYVLETALGNLNDVCQIRRQTSRSSFASLSDLRSFCSFDSNE
ncbi:protein serine/threonine kinase [Pelomyxa schiedti]|nr:protein serine/threonine kinase [Pelomyxa schiedti]